MEDWSVLNYYSNNACFDVWTAMIYMMKMNRQFMLWKDNLPLDTASIFLIRQETSLVRSDRSFWHGCLSMKYTKRSSILAASAGKHFLSVRVMISQLYGMGLYHYRGKRWVDRNDIQAAFPYDRYLRFGYCKGRRCLACPDVCACYRCGEMQQGSKLRRFIWQKKLSCKKGWSDEIK